MTPTEDEMDALNDVIRRLRAELERVREAGQAVVKADAKWDDPALAVAIEALRTALKDAIARAS